MNGLLYLTIDRIPTKITSQSHVREALFPPHRKDQTNVMSIMMDLQGMNILIAAVRSYMTPLTAAGKALHDTAFGTAVQYADDQYARIQAWIEAQ
jgi:hypothetical protein